MEADLNSNNSRIAGITQQPCRQPLLQQSGQALRCVVYLQHWQLAGPWHVPVVFTRYMSPSPSVLQAHQTHLLASCPLQFSRWQAPSCCRALLLRVAVWVVAAQSGHRPAPGTSSSSAPAHQHCTQRYHQYGHMHVLVGRTCTGQVYIWVHTYSTVSADVLLNATCQ